jgi:hypothetical protein
MSVDYYFYKQSNDYMPIDEGRYTGMPDFYEYGLEKISPCDSCQYKDNKSEFACYGCWDEMNMLYKITRDKLPEIKKNMTCNFDLFESLMDSCNQDYIWVRMS